MYPVCIRHILGGSYRDQQVLPSQRSAAGQFSQARPSFCRDNYSLCHSWSSPPFPLTQPQSRFRSMPVTRKQVQRYVVQGQPRRADNFSCAPRSSFFPHANNFTINGGTFISARRHHTSQILRHEVRQSAEASLPVYPFFCLTGLLTHHIPDCPA